MAYSEERIMILRMLQEGKITAEEAEKLLDALNDGKNQRQSEKAGGNSGTGTAGSAQYSAETQQGQYKKSNLQEELNKLKDNVNRWGQDLKNKYNQKDFDQSVEEFAQKAERVGKDVANTTIGVLDKVMDYVSSFIDTNTFRYFGDYNLEKRTYEAVVEDGTDIFIEGRNGQISVKKHEADTIKILTRIRCREENPDQFIIFEQNPNAVTLKLNTTSNISAAHEVFVPEAKYNSIRLLTTNARIYAENITAKYLELSTKNSSIDISGATSDKICLITKNAKIMANNIIAGDVTASTRNSSIDLKNIEAKLIDASTRNARINIETVHNYCDQGAASNITEMKLKTANSNIKVNMNDVDNMGYRVKALTSNGGINLLLPDVIYSNVNRPGAGGRFAEAESRGFEDYVCKIIIDAETSNGFIEIVK